MSANNSVNPCINSKNVIAIDDLSITFDKSKKIENCHNFLFKNINYQFEKGKIYFIIGQSGCGKTILINHINGLMKSKFGNIYIKDIAIMGNKKKIKHVIKLRKIISTVFQFPEYQLFKDTVESDIIFGPINLGVKKPEAKKLAKYYLEKLGLSINYLYANPFQLSGGQQRRVALAGVLAIQPEILIFDEPTVGLDPKGEKQILDIILSLKNEGKTIIIITHEMDQVLALADQVILVNNKKIEFNGNAYDFFTNQKFLTKTKITKPKIIDTIDKLVELNSKFKILYKKRPRTIEQLAQELLILIK